MDRYTQMRRVIFTGMVIVPVIPFLMALAVGTMSLVSALEDGASSTIRRTADDHADMVNSFLRERLADLEVAFSTLNPETLANNGGLNILFKNLEAASKAYADLGLIAPGGRQAAYVGPFSLGHVDYHAEAWYRNVLKSGSAVSEMFTGFRGIPHFIVAVARTIDGKQWVLRATINQDVFDRLVEHVRLGTTGEAFVVDAEGRLQTEPRSGGALLDTVSQGLPPKDGGTIYEAEVDGTTYLCASVPINNNRWRLVVRQDKWEALAPLEDASWMVIAILLAGGGLIAALAVVASGKMTGILRKADEAKDSLERQLVMASRLAELGEMAAGFAHEINNPLQVMKSDLTLMSMIVSDVTERPSLAFQEDESAELTESLNQIRTQIDRCAAITSAILKFGRHGERNPKRIDLGDSLPQIAGMISKKAQVSGINLSVDIPHGIGQVYTDEGELQQVVLNLLNNAIHAVCERHGASGGVIKLRADQKNAETVEVVVEDNGVGISQENIEKVFAPFFTTKPPGKGTGLGLAVCYGIVDRMGGNLRVESEKGSGTRFIIDLPVR